MWQPAFGSASLKQGTLHRECEFCFRDEELMEMRERTYSAFRNMRKMAAAMRSCKDNGTEFESELDELHDD